MQVPVVFMEIANDQIFKESDNATSPIQLYAATKKIK